MQLGLAGKKVVVTGASKGMGRSTVLSLLAEGAHVLAVARGAEALDALREGADGPGRLEVLVADVTDPAAGATVVDAAVRVLGGLEILVNTVGPTERVAGGIETQDDAVWERAFENVLMHSVRLCRAAIPVMVAGGGGAIVNTSAMSVRHHLPAIAHYSAMKAALAHFTKNLALELAVHGIRSNAVMPGMIESEEVAAGHRETIEREQIGADELFRRVNEKYHFLTVADRFGRPEEVAAAITFLVSERASYINGAVLNVDGGSQF